VPANAQRAGDQPEGDSDDDAHGRLAGSEKRGRDEQPVQHVKRRITEAHGDQATEGAFDGALEQFNKAFSITKSGKFSTRLGGVLQKESADLDELLAPERQASIFIAKTLTTPDQFTLMESLVRFDAKLSELSKSKPAAQPVAQTRRTRAVKAPAEAELENQINAAMRNILVQVENYPDLKANQNFLQLQEELSDIENKLAAARRFFNGATTEYNTAVETFPGNMIARNFGFQREILFDLGQDGRKQMEEPPKIQF